VSISRYPFRRYSLFQVPLAGFLLCLVIALLSFFLGFGRPPLAVAIALDLSGSTYPDGSTLFAPGSISVAEVEAVQEYLKLGGSQLKSPNEVFVFGFASQIKPLTEDFDSNTARIHESLDQVLTQGPLLSPQLGDGTDLALAITEGVQALGRFDDRCREMLVVTDGAVDIAPAATAQAIANRVKVHSVVIGSDSPALAAIALATRGIHLPGASPSQLKSLFTEDLFRSLNSNLRWIIFWLGMAWICLMWTLVLPLDRWIFQGIYNLPMDLAGQLALGNALFWTMATPGIVWRVAGGLALFSAC